MRRKRNRGILDRLWLVLLVGLAATCPCRADGPGTNVVAKGREEAYEEIRLLTEVLLHIKRQYVEEKSYEDIVHGGLRGMLQGLDPHSDFLDAEAYKMMKEDTTSKFGGIGINIGMKDGFLTVVAPMEDTPAFRAGLLSGDVIVKIDGQKTQGMNLQDAVKKLRGPKGEKVVVTIRRKGEEGTLDFEIIRDDIEIPSVKGGTMVRDGIGYVRVLQFSEPTAESLGRAVENLIRDGMKALVLDLRNNHGGLLRSAIEVSQMFLNKGELIVTTKGRPGVYEEAKALAAGEERYVEYPMAILVNGGSASASEIVAGALQDHKRAILVGETTFGKASVQSLINLKTDEKAAIRLTIARYYTPNGKEIQDKGIEPDIVVECSPKDWRDVSIRRSHLENPKLFTDEEKKKYEHVTDRQLERALDVLQGVLVFKK